MVIEIIAPIVFKEKQKRYNKEKHILRSNMVAALWKRSMIANIEMPDITQHGWDVNGNINWVEEVFPTDLDDYLDENGGESDNDD